MTTFNHFLTILFLISGVYCLSIQKFEISFSDYGQQSFIAPTQLTPMHIKLFWDDIYNCTIYPNITSFTHECSLKNNNTIISHSNLSTPKIEVWFNSTKRILIDNIKIYENEDQYFEINEFCVPEQYEFLQYNITKIRKDQCFNQLTPNKYLRQYNNLFIGQQSHIIQHTFLLPIPLNYSNVEAFVIPPSIKEIWIHVSQKYDKYQNPQTQFPIKISLWWYNKFYQCTMYPKNPNTTYKCIVYSDDISVCDINDMNSKHFGEFVLLMEKEANNHDALRIDRITVIDITDTFYGIEHFCVSNDDAEKASICKYKIMNQCKGFLGTNINIDKNSLPIIPNTFIDCNTSCIDSDGCGYNKLYFYFVNNLYKLHNQYAQSRIFPTINDTTEHCPVGNITNVSTLTPHTTVSPSFNLSHHNNELEFSTSVNSNNNQTMRYNDDLLTTIENEVQDLKNDAQVESTTTQRIDEHIYLIWKVLMGVVIGFIFILLFMVKIYVDMKYRNVPLQNPFIDGNITDVSRSIESDSGNYNSHLDSDGNNNIIINDVDKNGNDMNNINGINEVLSSSYVVVNHEDWEIVEKPSDIEQNNVDVQNEIM
eukprot:249096_1